MKYVCERECYAGIMKRWLKEEWCGYLKTEYEFSMAVCRSLASKETESIPAEQFREMADGRKITLIHTPLRNYQGEAKLIVIWF